MSIVYASNDLPKVYISGDIANMEDKSDIRNVEIEFDSKELNFKSYATLKIQGAFSVTYPKKNYNVRFYEDEQCTKKLKKDLGWGDFNKYVLKANWVDPIHSRNIVAADIASDINSKYGYFNGTPNNGAIDGYAVEVYVNDVFHGLYTLNLPKDYMFDDGKNEDYLLISTDGDFFTLVNIFGETEKWRHFEVEVGEQDSDSLEKLNRLLNFLTNSTPEYFREHIDEYINFDSMLNYYCFMRYADLIDNFTNNIYFLTYDGSYWYMAFYDLDTSFGYTWEPNNNFKNSRTYELGRNKMWTTFEKAFPDHIVVRYNELRQDILTEENIMKKFNSFYNTIPKEVFDKDRAIWTSLPKFEINTIDTFLEVHTPVIDAEIEKLKTDNYTNVYEEFSKFKIDNKDESENSNVIFVIITGILLIMLCVACFFIISRKRKMKGVGDEYEKVSEIC